MEKKKITRLLPVKLTRKELAQYGRQNAEQVRSAGSLEEEKSRVAKDYKTRIDHIMSQVRQRGDVIVAGEEDRDVEVKLVKDYKFNLERVYRLDQPAPEDSGAPGEEVTHMQRTLTPREIEEHRNPELPATSDPRVLAIKAELSKRKESKSK